MRVCALWLCVLACASHPRDGDTLARAAASAASRDVAAMTRLLRAPVVNAGVTFRDPACATRFGPGDVEEPEIAAFARCLVELDLKPSPRFSILDDIVVMTYAPGFELEARVVQDLAGPRLTWIGHASRVDHTQMISGAALEALRIAGDRHGDLGEALAHELPPAAEVGTVDTRYEYAFAWIRICLDATGKVTSAEPIMASSPAAAEAFHAGTTTWRFRPFRAGDRALAVCAMTRLVYPPSSASQREILPIPAPRSSSGKRPLALPSSVLDDRRRSGASIRLDLETRRAMKRAKLEELAGTFRICVGESGSVETVESIRPTRFPPYDRAIVERVLGWYFTPFEIAGAAIPVCSYRDVRYRRRSGPR